MGCVPSTSDISHEQSNKLESQGFSPSFQNNRTDKHSREIESVFVFNQIHHQRQLVRVFQSEAFRIICYCFSESSVYNLVSIYLESTMNYFICTFCNQKVPKTFGGEKTRLTKISVRFSSRSSHSFHPRTPVTPSHMHMFTNVCTSVSWWSIILKA